jgi:hypothetical protein
MNWPALSHHAFNDSQVAISGASVKILRGRGEAVLARLIISRSQVRILPPLQNVWFSGYASVRVDADD